MIFLNPKQIESWDFSHNKVLWRIAPTLAKIYTLSIFNVAYNNLWDKKTPDNLQHSKRVAKEIFFFVDWQGTKVATQGIYNGSATSCIIYIPSEAANKSAISVVCSICSLISTLISYNFYMQTLLKVLDACVAIGFTHSTTGQTCPLYWMDKWIKF